MVEVGSYEHYCSSPKDNMLLKALRDYLHLHQNQHHLAIHLCTRSQSIKSCVEGRNGHRDT